MLSLHPRAAVLEGPRAAVLGSQQPKSFPFCAQEQTSL